MSNFSDLSFEQRKKYMGDASETAFRRYAEQKGIKCERLGFDRSELPRFWLLSEFVKAMPDFVCIKGNNAFLVECKGCGGRDSRDHVKIRLLDLYQYVDWNEKETTFIFVWNSYTKEYSITESCDILHIAKEANDIGVFPDNKKEYYKVPLEKLIWHKLEKE